MKPRLLSVLLLGALAPLSAAQPVIPAASDDLVPFDQIFVRKHTTAGVLARYGPPPQRIGADLWVYWRFAEAPPAARRAGFDTLIVHVTGDDVQTLRIVNAEALRALLRQLGAANRAAVGTGNAR